MSDPYLGQITVFSFNYAPNGYAQCNGQLLPITQNQALYSLLGTLYGGDGRTTFGLPNLQGRIPYQISNSPVVLRGATGGEAQVTLTTSQIPSHTHLAYAANPATPVPDAATPAGNYWGAQGTVACFNTAAGTGNPAPVLDPSAIGTTGASAGHENRPPYLVLNFCIALTGVYPNRPN